MAASMVSCNNDDADFIEQPAPVAPKQEQPAEKPVVEETFDGNIYFSAFPEQLACVNEEYEVKVGDQVVNVNVETLEVAKQYPFTICASLTDADRKSRKTEYKFVEPTVYVYRIPAQMNGQVSVTPKWTIKEGYDVPECINATYGIATNLRCQFHYEVIDNIYVDKLINVANKLTYENVVTMK